MAVEVETPEDYMGDVMGDLSSRRGMVQGMEDMAGGGKSSRPKCRWPKCLVIRRRCVPLTQGRATYTMEFKHYDRSAEAMSLKQSIEQVKIISIQIRSRR